METLTGMERKQMLERIAALEQNCYRTGELHGRIDELEKAVAMPGSWTFAVDLQLLKNQVDELEKTIRRGDMVITCDNCKHGPFYSGLCFCHDCIRGKNTSDGWAAKAETSEPSEPIGVDHNGTPLFKGDTLMLSTFSGYLDCIKSPELGIAERRISLDGTVQVKVDDHFSARWMCDAVILYERAKATR